MHVKIISENLFRILVLSIISFLCLLFLKNEVYAANGKENSPYEASSYSTLKSALTTHTGNSGYIYIAITKDFTITDNIKVTKGKYRIFAKGENRIIKKSTSINSNINNQKDAKYCITLESGSEVNIGYDKGHYLYCDGQKNIVNKNSMITNGYIRVQEGGSLIVGNKGVIENVRNNKDAAYGAAVTCLGTMRLDGYIIACEGLCGGGIKINGGNLVLNDKSVVMNCETTGEGGGIHVNKKGNLTMNGGNVEFNTSAEEGGGIYFGDEGTIKINSGIINSNMAGGSGGGVFAGIGAKCYVGQSTGNGPTIKKNTSAVSGGGLRCNGGGAGIGGGDSYIYNGTISENHANKYGGGISVGEASKYKSKILIKDIKILNNTSDYYGGGIFFNDSNIGFDGDTISMENAKIYGNSARLGGGGIFTAASISTANCSVSSNSSNEGGGIMINSNGRFSSRSGAIENNKATSNGNGVYVSGKMEIYGNFRADLNDVIYLNTSCFVDIVTKLNLSGKIATLDSKQKTNGTVLVKVSGDEKLGHKYLYKSNETGNGEYNDLNIFKYFDYNKLATNRSIRSGNNIKNVPDNFIVLSEKYNIKYNKNTYANVSNMPESQIKFWNEDTRLSSKLVERKYYSVDKDKHWNTAKDGSGSRMEEGKMIADNKNMELYAIWKLNYNEIDFSIYVGRVRFISKDYLDTLFEKSIWRNENKEELLDSLNRKEGIFKINISQQQRKNIENRIINNNYKIDNKINSKLEGEVL